MEGHLYWSNVMKLTRNQRSAIIHQGINLQLVACAGSGKTEVVAQRVAHLLDPSKGERLRPRNIIAFTFTEKAAGELKERIVTRTREALGNVPGMAEMFVGTIHAFCLDLLKSESPKHLKYEVLNEVQQVLLIDRNSRQSGLTTSLDLGGAPLKRYTDTPRYVAALSILREAERHDKDLAGCSLVDGLEAYQKLLDQKGYLDYSSILQEAVTLLTGDPGLRSRLAERVKYVIVDEYQDVNPIQEKIIASLHQLGARICVVGDDDQTLYQWRGSSVDNILTFAKRYPKVDPITLEENFRSSEGIVETARPFIEQNSTRLPKIMKPAGDQTFEAGDIIALGFPDPKAEAAHIVATVKALQGLAFIDGEGKRGLCLSDMAVLLRSVKANATPIIQALDAAGIHSVVTGMTNLFTTKEAEAARILFYFMASRTDVDESALLKAWQTADLGLEPRKLKLAIAGAQASRGALTAEDKGSWGQYSVQRVFLAFLETAGVREETIPGGRGEVVFYNLGKFSQVISDFESIHFHSKPVDKYASFADFLQHRAQDAYPEGWQDTQYANPNAVQIMTIHQAKGMQWPVVFVPALLKNRFPSKKPGGRSVWHLLPRTGIQGQARFEGTEEDERRLFYVAMTRSQKFLHFTWAPVPGNQLFQKCSQFWTDILVSKYVKRRAWDYGSRERCAPRPRTSLANVIFSFSDIKYFFECAYQFKLRILYGFNPPIHEALGYGKSLHDALAEVHARVIRGAVPSVDEAHDLVQTHLHTPYAYPALRETLAASAEKIIKNYLIDNAKVFPYLEFSEKTVEISLGDGVTVNGRIDLVRRKDTGETTIVDLKSTERAQPENVTETQLHIYALGYRQLTGNRPDFVEIYELDGRKKKPRSVDDDFLQEVEGKVLNAAMALRRNNLTASPELRKCSGCDYRGMCNSGCSVSV